MFLEDLQQFFAVWAEGGHTEEEYAAGEQYDGADCDPGDPVVAGGFSPYQAQGPEGGSDQGDCHGQLRQGQEEDGDQGQAEGDISQGGG